MLLSLRNSAVENIESNALLKSNSSAVVTRFLSRPDLISSVSLSRLRRYYGVFGSQLEVDEGSLF